MPGSLIQGNALHIPLKDKSVQLCCFSPPYFGLRTYKVSNIVFNSNSKCKHIWGNKTIKKMTGGTKKSTLGLMSGGHDMSNKARLKSIERSKYEASQGRFCEKCGAWEGQMGLEPNIDQYLDNLMLAMAEVWRVLRNDGVVFVNIGDSYWNPAGSCNSRKYGKTTKRAGKKDVTSLPLHRGNKSDNPNMRPKSLCLIPQKFAIRCQEAGWLVRSEVIFHKINPIPESCSDRPTKAHEQVWLLTKSGKYFWDKEAVKERTRLITHTEWKDSNLKKYSCDPRLEKQSTYKNWQKYRPTGNVNRRNIRSVWTMATEPHSEAHFATFPSKLVDVMIRAGSSPKNCEICGAPWVRILKKETAQCPESKDAQYAGKYYEEDRRSAGQRVLKNIAELRARGKDHDNTFSRIRTIGWQKTCKCKCAGTGRCVVLDPFVGIGTSVIVAEKHGRAGVGMDLSLEYLVDIALKKIRIPVQKMLELRF